MFVDLYTCLFVSLLVGSAISPKKNLCRWSSPESPTLAFYQCPIRDACLPGGNGTRSRCAVGYGYVACSLCVDGYFEQFGRCVACPRTSGSSLAALIGIALTIVVLCVVVYKARSVLPTNVMKLGLSMLQVRCVVEMRLLHCCLSRAVQTTDSRHALSPPFLQILASASTAYDIPWPPALMSTFSSARLFLVRCRTSATVQRILAVTCMCCCACT
jgi:hypothetical protein